MYIMTLVPLFIVLPLIAAAAWFFRHKIKDYLRRCRGRVARARHSISSGGKVPALGLIKFSAYFSQSVARF